MKASKFSGIRAIRARERSAGSHHICTGDRWGTGGVHQVGRFGIQFLRLKRIADLRPIAGCRKRRNWHKRDEK